MFGKLLVPAAIIVSAALPASAQQAPAPAAAPLQTAAAPPTPVVADGFRAGSEVLSVDGEPLGELAYVYTLDGEPVLHIRRSDGTVATAPAAVASQGERAVVLEWTRAEFENPARKVVAPEPVAPTPE